MGGPSVDLMERSRDLLEGHEINKTRLSRGSARRT